MKNSLFGKSTQIIGLGMFILLIVSTLLLSAENRKLKQRLEELLSPRGNDVLKVGDSLSSVELRTLQDSAYIVNPSASGKGRVLMLVSTTCPACEKSLPLLQGIAQEAGVLGFEVIFISIHDRTRTMEFARKYGLDYMVLIAADSLQRARLKANAVPQTILFSPTGHVWNNWIGLVDSTRQREIIGSMIAKRGGSNEQI